mgnify:CR=1 FL=1
MDNLKNTLAEVSESVLEMYHDTINFKPDMPFEECFPMDMYRRVEHNGEWYYMKAHFEMKKIDL